MENLIEELKKLESECIKAQQYALASRTRDIRKRVEDGKL